MALIYKTGQISSFYSNVAHSIGVYESVQSLFVYDFLLFANVQQRYVISDINQISINTVPNVQLTDALQNKNSRWSNVKSQKVFKKKQLSLVAPELSEAHFFLYLLLRCSQPCLPVSRAIINKKIRLA